MRFDPPAHVDDLAGRPTRQDFLDGWDGFISGEIKNNIGLLADPRDEHDRLVDTPIPEPLFFSEADGPAASDDVPVTWNAFPLAITRRSGKDEQRAWAMADALQSTAAFSPDGGPRFSAKFRPQDEYCEWHADVDPVTRRLRKIVFTSEGPEYWIRLAKSDFGRVVELYRELVSPEVRDEELKLPQDIVFGGDVLPAGSYNPFNAWNTERGAVHLTHPANTLGAEINLAARATAMRRDGAGARVFETRRLICCSAYGSPNRSSDPTIGQTVNVTALSPGGASPQAITLANPIALYMNELKAGTLTDVDGNPRDDWFRFVRGGPGLGLRAVLAPPDGSPDGFDTLRVKGERLTFGGQVAAAIQMVLYARTKPFTGAAPPLAPCPHRCCMPSGTAPAKVKDVNLDVPGTGEGCGAGREDAFPELAAEESLAASAPRGPVGRIWRRTRLGISQ